MRYIAIIISLLGFLFFSGCEKPNNSTAYTPPPMEGQKNLSAEGDEKQNLPYSSNQISSETIINPLIELDTAHVLLKVFNLNLDLDRGEEQVLLYKERDNPESKIFIAIADYDMVRNKYIAAWESETSSVNIRTFSVSFDDIVGDHSLEIVCVGTNSLGEQTIDIYHKTRAPSGTNLFYSTILSVVTDGSIEINQIQRSEAYKLGQKHGKSYPITVYSHDKDSENIMDLEKKTYYWQYQSDKYVLGNVEKIPGKNIEEEQLKELYSQDEEAFKSFLDGPWYKSGTSEINEFLVFDSESRQITIFSNNLEEIFYWKSSHRTRIPNSMYIIGNNSLVPFIEKQIAVYILSLNSISVSIRDIDFQKGGNQWDGTYLKLTENLKKSVVSDYQLQKKRVIDPINLNGTFTSSGGFSLTFDFPRFIMEENGVKKYGGYTIFDIESPVLQMKIVGENGLVKEKRSYKVDYKKDEKSTEIVHTLILSPGNITSKGFIPRDDETIHMEKIEIVEQNNASSEL